MRRSSPSVSTTAARSPATRPGAAAAAGAAAQRQAVTLGGDDGRDAAGGDGGAGSGRGEEAEGEQQREREEAGQRPGVEGYRGHGHRRDSSLIAGRRAAGAIPQVVG